MAEGVPEDLQRWAAKRQIGRSFAPLPKGLRDSDGVQFAAEKDTPFGVVIMGNRGGEGHRPSGKQVVEILE